MLNNDFQKLSVEGLITLYELDATALGAGILRWHGHVNYEDFKLIIAWAGRQDRNTGNTVENVGAELVYTDEGLMQKRNLIFQGKTYSPVAIDSEGLEQRGDGRASSPTLSIANSIDGVQGAISAYCQQYDDFAGAKLTIITTLAKYLDAENFLNGNASASNEYKSQNWFIERLTSMNALQVSFELSNPIDFDGKRIPCREINNYCQWAVNGDYRGESCGYIGAAMYTDEDKPTTDPTKDKCSGRLQGCRVRFGANKPLPFGGFPSSSMNDR